MSARSTTACRRSPSFDFGQYAGSGDRTAGDARLAERLGDEAGACHGTRELRVAVQGGGETIGVMVKCLIAITLPYSELEYVVGDLADVVQVAPSCRNG